MYFHYIYTYIYTCIRQPAHKYMFLSMILCRCIHVFFMSYVSNTLLCMHAQVTVSPAKLTIRASIGMEQMINNDYNICIE